MFTTLAEASQASGPSTGWLIDAARSVLQDESDALISGVTPRGTHTTISESGVRQSADARAIAIAHRRAFNAKYGVRFISAQFVLGKPNVARVGNRIHLEVWESFAQTSVGAEMPDKPEVTRGLRPHTFVFESDTRRGWSLVGHAEAPLPSNPLEPAAVDASVLPSAGRSTRLRGNSAAVVGRAGNARPLGAGFYDRAAAQQYTIRWAETYNSYYRNFENAGSEGGDCTNFVSQVLRAGGWQDKIGYYQDWSYWWYDSWLQTRTWTYAPALKYFLETQGRAHVYWYFEDLRVGDPMSIDWGANGTIDHTMVVDERYAPGTAYIFMSYHTYPTYHRRLSDILASNPPETNAYFAFSIDGTY